MATNMILSLLLVSVLISLTTTATNIPSRNQDLIVAIEEMQKANYFTFVMLINMVPADLNLGNVTFLMPNDRTLSKAMIPENAVVEFLLRHSIPSPLLFDHLEHFPTGSMIPTSKPEFMLKVSNDGRWHFFLNNARIISPNICTAGSSIRCHGIDGVLVNTHPSTTCSNDRSPPVAAAVPPAPSLAPPPVGGLNLSPLATPPPTDPNATSQKSGGSHQLCQGRLLKIVMTCIMLLTLMFFI